MTTEERRALLDRAITAYGAPAQIDMAVEEMAELTKALCKIKRAQAGCEVTAAIGNVVEEMADVQIMLDQLRIIPAILLRRQQGVAEVDRQHRTERKNGKAPKIANDILSTRGYQNLIRGALTDIPCLYAYIFTDWRMWVYLFDLVEAAGFGVKSEIVWDKGTPGMGVGWRSQHELILFGAKAATHFDGHKGYGNVLSISRSGNELHPTQKPVELLEKLVDNTDFATGVYDPFGGSGTTLAACEAYGQPSYIMELTPAFTDVIVKRYIRITGKTTVRCVRQGRELPREEIAAIFEPDEEGGEQE